MNRIFKNRENNPADTNRKDEFSWLDPSIPAAVDNAKNDLYVRLLGKISKEDWLKARKNIYALYLYSQISENKALPVVINQKLAVWTKNKVFQNVKDQYLKDNMEKFRICGMVCVMTATLVFYFAKAMMSQTYVVNFSVDALVAVLALVFLIRNIQIKYRITSSFSKSKDFLLLDLLSVILCMLFKMMLPAGFDVSLIILLVSYFAQKKKLQKSMDQLSLELK